MPASKLSKGGHHQTASDQDKNRKRTRTANDEDIDRSVSNRSAVYERVESHPRKRRARGNHRGLLSNDEEKRNEGACTNGVVSSGTENSADSGISGEFQVSPPQVTVHYVSMPTAEGNAEIGPVDTVSISQASGGIQDLTSSTIKSFNDGTTDSCDAETLKFTHMNPAKLHERWPISSEQWKVMVDKDWEYVRSANLFLHHPELNPLMRSFTVGWLAMACETVGADKETFQLSVDYMDRLLTSSMGVEFSQLQTIATTCLFIALKLQHKSERSISDLNKYVPEKGCWLELVMNQEYHVLEVLQWKLRPVTTNQWLIFYMQVGRLNINIPEPQNPVWAVEYDKFALCRVSRLTDLCLMDHGSLQFPYRLIAAAALVFFTSINFATSVSNLTWRDLEPCVSWMIPFYKSLLGDRDYQVQERPGVIGDAIFDTQCHYINLRLHEQADALKPQFEDMLITSVISPQYELTATRARIFTHPSQVFHLPSAEDSSSRTPYQPDCSDISDEDIEESDSSSSSGFSDSE